MVPIIHWLKGPNQTKAKQACYRCLAKQPHKPIGSWQWKWHSFYSTSVVERKTIAQNFKYRFRVISYNTIIHKSIFCPRLYYCLQMQLSLLIKAKYSWVRVIARTLHLEGEYKAFLTHKAAHTYQTISRNPRENLQGRKQKGPSSISSLPHVTTYSLTKWKWSTQA